MYTKPKPELAHIATRLYDPVKAHQYYLRTRKLKGRKRGRAEPVQVDRRGGPATKLVGQLLKTPAGKRPVSNNAQLNRQRQQAAARVSTLRKKLSELNARLKEKLAEQRETEKKEKKGPTSAEKREAAERSRDWRSKNQQKVKQQAKERAAKEKNTKEGEPKKSGGGEDSIEGIRTAITNVKSALAKAVERQRALG